jgi:hypothetical protein
LDAETEHVPLALVTDNCAPATAHPVDVPELNVTAPVPPPPEEDKVAVLPYVRLAGPLTVNAACVAFTSVTSTSVDVACS